MGRANAQSFLSKYFHVSTQNYLVKENLEWYIAKGFGLDIDNQVTTDPDRVKYIQVIPIVPSDMGDSRNYYSEIKLPLDALNPIKKQIQKRLSRVLAHEIDMQKAKRQAKKNFWQRLKITFEFWMVGLAKRFYIDNAIYEKVVKIIESDLKKRNLLEE